MQRPLHREWEDELTVEDFILAVLYYAGGRIPTKTHLMKILAAYAVLSGKEDFFEYTPYRMGLYSLEVEAALQNLIDYGYVKRAKGYRLIGRGLEEARRSVEAIERLLPEDAALLRSLAQRLRRLETEEVLLLHYVLFCDEKCRKVSEKWKEIESKRLKIALEMLKRGKVSWRLAARLAGMEPEEFLKHAVQQGIAAGDELRLEDIKAAEEDANTIRARLKRSRNG